MDLTYDCTFKYLMKSPKTRFFLLELVTEVVLEDKNWVCDHLVIEDGELVDSFFKHEKRKVTDVLVRCGNYTVNIEMNRKYYEHIFENKLRYPHHLYNESYLKGSDDSQKIIIQININDFKGEMKEGIEYVYYQTKDMIYTKKIRIINVSLVNLLKKWDNKVTLSKLEKLLLYIKMSQMDKKIIDEYVKGDEVLMKAEALRELMEYEDSLMMAFNKEEEDAREQRLIQKTIQKETKISIAKNMLEAKLPIQVITSCTGLTKQQISEL